MKHIIITTFVLCFCIISYGQDKTINKSFENVKSIRLTTSSGNINLKKGSGSSVKLTLKYSYSDDEFKPIFEENSGKLTLKEDFSRGNHSGNSNWDLELPDNISLNINTGSGDLSIAELQADVKTNLGSGDIDIHNVKGDLNFNTGSGNIELHKFEGEIRLNTGSGDIRAEGGSGSFSFNAGSGNIKLIKLNGDFSMNTGSGNIKAEDLGINSSSSFNTGSGDATVVLSSELNHSISVNSGSGDATLNFNGNEIGGLITMTANKRGGNIVAPFKFDKEETIEDNNSSARIQKTAKLGSKDIQIKIGTGSGTAEISK